MSKKSHVSLSALTALYGELNSAGKAEDYERAIKIANKILSLDKAAVKAFHYKMVCLIYLDKFQDVLKQLRSSSAKLTGGLHFEQAYCQYRVNDHSGALQTLAQCPQDTSTRCKQLRAQLLYGLENYSEACALLKDVAKNTDDDFNNERQANIGAAQAQLLLQQKFNGEPVGSAANIAPQGGATSSSSYEQLYNSACQLIAVGQLARAAELLQRSAAVAKQQLLEDGAEPAEIQQELAVINAQLGYCRQCTGCETAAAAIYHDLGRVARAAGSASAVDAALLLTVSNNVVVLNGQRNLFDSRKRIKTLATAVLAATGGDGTGGAGGGGAVKLTGWQRRQLAINVCIFHSLTHQSEQLERHLAALGVNSSNDNSHHQQQQHQQLMCLATLLRAAQLARADPARADQLLTDQLAAAAVAADNTSDQQLQLQLARAQLLVNKGDFRGASQLLEQLPASERVRAGVVSARVALLERAGCHSEAAQVIEHMAATGSGSKDKGASVSVLLRQRAATLQIRSGNLSAASHTLEQLVAQSPNNHQLLAQLVLVYCQLERAKAVGLAARLPNCPQSSQCASSAVGAVPALSLEETGWLGGARALAKRTGVPGSAGGSAGGGKSPQTRSNTQSPEAAAAAAAAAAAGGAAGGGDLQRRSERRSRRRKPRLPQNYNAAVPPDPERWLPRRQRTAYRAKRRHRRLDAGKGTQGGPVTQSDLYDITKTAPQQKSSPAADQPAVTPRAPNRNVQKKRKQTKRSSKW